MVCASPMRETIQTKVPHPLGVQSAYELDRSIVGADIEYDVDPTSHAVCAIVFVTDT